jgi:hypothetical protein
MLSTTYVINHKTIISSDRYCQSAHDMNVRFVRDFFKQYVSIMRSRHYQNMYPSGYYHINILNNAKFLISQLRMHYSAMESFRRV